MRHRFVLSLFLKNITRTKANNLIHFEWADRHHNYCIDAVEIFKYIYKYAVRWDVSVYLLIIIIIMAS